MKDARQAPGTRLELRECDDRYYTPTIMIKGDLNDGE